MLKVILAIITLIFLVVVFVDVFFPPIMVVGDSMTPTYRDGEIVFGIRFFPRRKLKVGDVIVFKHPYVKKRLLIKRIEEVSYHKGKVDCFYVLGDNRGHSNDSRNFGQIFVENVVAKVMFGREREE